MILFEIAVEFRKAIIQVKNNNEFDYRDRMYRFPSGCCDDSCDLLGYYLLHRYGIHTMQEIGEYRDGNPENTFNHAWLVTDDDIIIDITMDQFKNQFEETDVDVFIGRKSDHSFYSIFDDYSKHNNFNIENQERLYKDYLKIIEYLKK